MPWTALAAACRLRPAALLASLLTLVTVGTAVSAAEAGPGPDHLTSARVTLSAGPSARPGIATHVLLRLPAGVTAVEGRLLLPPGTAEVVGAAPMGGGRALRPVDIAGGARFAAYGLDPAGAAVALVLVPRGAGSIAVRVVVDAIGSRSGARVRALEAVLMTRVGHERSTGALPTAAGPRTPADAARATPRELVRDGRLDRRDLDAALAAWLGASEATRCGSGAAEADANGDGCLDVLDLQALAAARGTRVAGTGDARRPGRRVRAARPASATFTVTSTGDTPDASIGDGACADAAGACTLRAAIAEANALAGDDTIAFALPGTPPVRIALTRVLPEISSRVGTLVIDGYTQPGSRVNDAAFGSNAIPGVELRGAGVSETPQGLFITSPGNTVRGLAFARFNKAIFLTGADAHDNRIVGNWVGYRADGSNAALADSGVVLDGGAHHNVVGTADRADRNVIGNWRNAIDLYGAGTDGNVIRGNLLCTRPSGFAPASCMTGIDLDYGIKDTLIGGDAAGERNVIGPTKLQAVELSHAWDPTAGPGDDPGGRYALTGNQVVGNWLGFRADGSYDPAFRSGLRGRRNDNGNGVNVIDGPTGNLVARNHIASLADGIQLLASTTRSNQVVGNTIGIAPRGGAAPLTGWGIRVRLGANDVLLEANRIANAAEGGIGLTHPSVRRVRMTRNLVSSTSGPPIDLFGFPGPDPNDPGDRDAGANTLLNTPLVGRATTNVVRGTGIPGATVEVYRASRPRGSRGLPVAYVGTTTVGEDGRWTLRTQVLVAGQRATALQIVSNGNTSELAPNRVVAVAP